MEELHALLSHFSYSCTGKAKNIFTHSKKYNRFFRTKEFVRISRGFILNTKEFLPKVRQAFGSEILVGKRFSSGSGHF